jgi:hypothetical protein
MQINDLKAIVVRKGGFVPAGRARSATVECLMPAFGTRMSVSE